MELNRSLFVLALVSQLVSAGTFVRDPGCYLIHGRVTRIQGKNIQLTTAERSRSRAVIRVTFDKAPDLRLKQPIDIVVYAPTGGRESEILFRASNDGYEYSRVFRPWGDWRWMGAATNGKCSRGPK